MNTINKTVNNKTNIRILFRTGGSLTVFTSFISKRPLRTDTFVIKGFSFTKSPLHISKSSPVEAGEALYRNRTTRTTYPYLFLGVMA